MRTQNPVVAVVLSGLLRIWHAVAVLLTHFWLNLTGGIKSCRLFRLLGTRHRTRSAVTLSLALAVSSDYYIRRMDISILMDSRSLADYWSIVSSSVPCWYRSLASLVDADCRFGTIIRQSVAGRLCNVQFACPEVYQGVAPFGCQLDNLAIVFIVAGAQTAGRRVRNS